MAAFFVRHSNFENQKLTTPFRELCIHSLPYAFEFRRTCFRLENRRCKPAASELCRAP